VELTHDHENKVRQAGDRQSSVVLNLIVTQDRGVEK